MPASRRIGIIDYGMGNIKSVQNALHFLGETVKLVKVDTDLEACTHFILPGVGAFPEAMKNLKDQGLVDPLISCVSRGMPLLGICLGMQLLAEEGEEIEPCRGLGLVPGRVRRLNVSLHVPHIGWNTVVVKRPHPVFKGMKKDVDFYFVHSYFFDVKQNEDLLAVTDYEADFPCAVTNGRSVVGVQFHPEKSQDSGLKILQNFCEWDGASC